MSKLPDYEYPNGILSNEQLKALGAVSFEAAYLEQVIDNFITYALDTDKAGFDLIAKRMLLDSKFDFLYAILKLKLKPTALAKFEEAYSLGKSALSERNMVIHGEWLYSTEAWLQGLAKTPHEESITVRTHKNGGQPKIIKASQIEKIAAQIWQTTDTIKELRWKLRLRASRSKSA